MLSFEQINGHSIGTQKDGTRPMLYSLQTCAADGLVATQFTLK